MGAAGCPTWEFAIGLYVNIYSPRDVSTYRDADLDIRPVGWGRPRRHGLVPEGMSGRSGFRVWVRIGRCGGRDRLRVWAAGCGAWGAGGKACFGAVGRLWLGRPKRCTCCLAVSLYKFFMHIHEAKSSSLCAFPLNLARVAPVGWTMPRLNSASREPLASH